MSSRTAAPDNHLLAALPPGDRALVDRYLHPVDLPTPKVLHVAGEPLTHAYFLVQGIASMVSEMDEGVVEVGTAGREGMVGLPILLRSGPTTTRTFMQVAGRGWQCTADDLLAAVAEVPALSLLLHRYAQVLFEQVSQSAACNRLHSLEQRCARWLLMVHDRVDDEVLPLKQTFLADMLGVHRPAVTLAAGALQSSGLIRYSRGKVQVLDRAGLEEASCACYGIVRDRFQWLLGAGTGVGAGA